MPTEKLFRLRTVFALLLGMAVTFTLHGYRYGRSNQSVYLLDALQRANPELLANDWFTTQTLQYHWAFSLAAAALMRLHCIEPAFLAFYVVLLGVFHFAWLRIVRHLGGGMAAYLIAVTISALAAGDTGLGMYQFFQDGSLLPSNVSNVMLLAGIAAWVERKIFTASVCFGLAGIFHLNHALVGSGLWIALSLALYAGRGQGRGSSIFVVSRKPKTGRPSPLHSPRVQGEGVVVLATTGALLPSAVNVAIAAHAKLMRSGALSLKEFVDLYVRLRHPHHYQPSSWPIAIWLCALALAAIALWRLSGPLRLVTTFFIGLMAVALLGAGVFWVSETLVQLSLFRFSIYVNLLGCTALALWLNHRRSRAVAGGAILFCTTSVVVCAWLGPYGGSFKLPKDDDGYRRLCLWAREHTPVDAVFIVPPDEESMRLIGERAIVVNFKGVPQLSAELIEWRERLCDVLDLPTLQSVPHGYSQTLEWMRLRYDQLDARELNAAAQKYHADFIVTRHEVPALESSRVETAIETPYALYAIARDKK